MRDDELRSLLAGYDAAPIGTPPAASTLRQAAGRRRALSVGGAALGIGALGIAGVQLLPRPVAPNPTATPGPTTASTTARTRTCSEVAKAWADALTTPPNFPAALGSAPRLTGHLMDGTLIASAKSGSREVAATFPAGLDGPMLRFEAEAGETPYVLASDGTRAVIRIGPAGPDRAPDQTYKLAIIDGPGAPARALVHGAHLALPPGRATAYIAGDSLRVLESESGTPSPSLLLHEVPLEGDAAPTVRRLDSAQIGALGYPQLTRTLMLHQDGDGKWRCRRLDDLTRVEAPPGVTTLDRADFPVQCLDGRRILFYTGRNTSAPTAWSYDPGTGNVRKLMEGVALASTYGDLALGVLDRQWRLRDLASGNEVALPLPVPLDGMVALGDTVCAWIPQPTGLVGAVFPLASVPTTIPAC